MFHDREQLHVSEFMRCMCRRTERGAFAMLNERP